MMRDVESMSGILIVEDEPSIAEVVSLYLRRAGYQVQVISDGEAALRSMKKIIAFADIVVPGHDAPFEVDRRNDRFIPNRA